jgi:hypothetical protein
LNLAVALRTFMMSRSTASPKPLGSGFAKNARRWPAADRPQVMRLLESNAA